MLLTSHVMSINMELAVAVITIIGFFAAGVGVLLRMSNKYSQDSANITLALSEVTINLKMQTDEITELKSYRSDIDANSKDIQELKLTKVNDDTFIKHIKEFTELQTAHKLCKGGMNNAND